MEGALDWENMEVADASVNGDCYELNNCEAEEAEAQQMEMVLSFLCSFSIMLCAIYYMFRSCKDGKRNVDNDDAQELGSKKYANVNITEEDAVEMV